MATKKIQILDYTIKQAENANALGGKAAEEFATVDYVDEKIANVGGVVDTEMSDTSENPVENKAIKAYVDEKVANAETTDNKVNVVDMGIAYENPEAYPTLLAVWNFGSNHLDQAKAYADEKLFPATSETYGTVKVCTNELMARMNGGIYMPSDGMLAFVSANEADIDGKANDTSPITPANLDYAVKSVGDGYYALADDVGNAETTDNKVISIDDSDDDNETLYPSVLALVSYINKRFNEWLPPAVEVPIASSEDYGIVKVADNEAMASFNGGIYIDANGCLTIAPKAVKAICDAYYAPASDVGEIDTAIDSIIDIQESLIHSALPSAEGVEF